MAVPNQALSFLVACMACLIVWSIGAGGLINRGDYLHRGFMKELGMAMFSQRYEVAVACPEPPYYRLYSLRAHDWQDAKAYVRATFPECETSLLTHRRQSW